MVSRQYNSNDTGMCCKQLHTIPADLKRWEHSRPSTRAQQCSRQHLASNKGKLLLPMAKKSTSPAPAPAPAKECRWLGVLGTLQLGMAGVTASDAMGVSMPARQLASEPEPINGAVSAGDCVTAAYWVAAQGVSVQHLPIVES